MTMTVGAMQPSDWPAVRVIYEEGIVTGNATFETKAPTWAVWDADHLPDCRLVAREDGCVMGWAALSATSKRAVYAGVAEVSVYVAEAVRGRGVGKALLQALVEASEQHDIWTLQGGIFPENVASLALHQACGFRVVGRRERIGQMPRIGPMRGTWRDTLLLERRSRTVGVGSAFE